MGGAGAGAAKRRIGHHQHTVTFAPWQQVAFNAAVAEVIKDLIGRAAIALWSMKQIFHSTHVLLLAPKASLAVRADLHPALQYLLLNAAVQIHSQPGIFQKAGQFPQPNQSIFR